MTSDINVYVRGGFYPGSHTVAFDQRDSGMNGHQIIYQAYSGEIPRISGGQRITGWTANGNGIYKTNVGSLRFRQLYVNGIRATRARTPVSGTYYNAIQWDEDKQALVIEADKISNWANLNEVELHINKSWDISVFRIASFSTSGDQAIVIPTEPERTLIFAQDVHFRANNEPYFFENAMEFLNGKGQWYLNASTGDLFYFPRTGENMSTAEVIAPKVERLVSIKGILDAPVRNLLFYGLTFEHSTYLDPNTQGFIGLGNSIWGTGVDERQGFVPTAIYLSSTENIQFERNTFQHLGGSALGLDSDTHSNSVIGNVFTDISSNAINVDMTIIENPEDARVVPLGNVIRNNFITQVGQQYEGAAGIMVAYTSGTIIEHNEISNMPYNGILEGFGWTHADTQISNNLIRYNNIHGVMRLLDDGGGIYMNSKQPGSIASENYIHDIVRSPWSTYLAPVTGIYLDQGADSITVANNVVANDLGLFLQRCCGAASNNTIINFPLDVGVAGNIDDNTFVMDNTFSPAGVIANAGIEAAYQDILDGGPAKALGEPSLEESR
jgi:hypothetical protein